MQEAGSLHPGDIAQRARLGVDLLALLFLTLLRNVHLQEAGTLYVGDIAQRTRLGVDLLAPALAARLGTLIPGKLEGGLLYTEAHVARVRVTLRLEHVKLQLYTHEAGGLPAV
jgi:E3 UFM1-protein ligase 1